MTKKALTYFLLASLAKKEEKWFIFRTSEASAKCLLPFLSCTKENVIIL